MNTNQAFTLQVEKRSIRTHLKKLSARKNLEFEEMAEAMEIILNDAVSDSEVAAFLMALKAKGETVEEIAALVGVLRENALPIRRTMTNVMDNCGTGGDGSHSFNISTASAFVLAGADVTVAKHGNRSVTSRTGSSDVLSELGVALDFGPEDTDMMLQENNIAFLFAPHVHPKLRQIMKVRQDLRVPTIFNLIGPLINPVELDHQFLGIYDRSQLVMMATVLKRLGRKRAVVINGAGHMDEASLAGENHMALLEGGAIYEMKFTPESVGLTTYPLEEIVGGDSSKNAEILKNVLGGNATPAQRDTVLLNAGLGMYAAGAADSIEAGIGLARESIETGNALAKLRNMVKYSNERVI
ncbi:MAG TPA: anthranilate phosphoribosyltransferase [Candidatus Salinicoccus stercoripullorum]|uniref:Anthranilate phosphoribosyltransferase n=1 Tax=Candidatus Salinicoccus stercoripullorum TaxID=2838756 RepID=A0A9D1U0R9_9STAP|nr:anthranilate phosphoribosyltransferase [Candidatus Salinicoccus stercoripullorum]